MINPQGDRCYWQVLYSKVHKSGRPVQPCKMCCGLGRFWYIQKRNFTFVFLITLLDVTVHPFCQYSIDIYWGLSCYRWVVELLRGVCVHIEFLRPHLCRPMYFSKKSCPWKIQVNISWSAICIRISRGQWLNGIFRQTRLSCLFKFHTTDASVLSQPKKHMSYIPHPLYSLEMHSL